MLFLLFFQVGEEYVRILQAKRHVLQYCLCNISCYYHSHFLVYIPFNLLVVFENTYCVESILHRCFNDCRVSTK